MKPNRFALLVPVLAALAVPGAAAAATATSNAADGMRYIGTSAADNPRISLAGSTFTIDDSAPVQAGAGCQPVAGDATKVTCVAFKDGAQLKRFQLELGAGNDSAVNLTPAPMLAIGSSGNDTLDGSAKARDTLRGGTDVDLLRDDGGFMNELDGGAHSDTLLGGESTDRLNGGSSPDVLDGRGGDDLLDGGSGADQIDGGADGFQPFERHDLVLYQGRSAPLTVDLDLTGPQPGAEGDSLVDVEDVAGGDGDDMLIGNDQGNRMDGGDGDDSLKGEGGFDHLTGGAGADALFASPDDGFFGIVPDGVADILDCSGPGVSVDPGDFAFRELADDDQVIKCAHVLDA